MSNCIVIRLRRGVEFTSSNNAISLSMIDMSINDDTSDVT